MSEAEPIPQAPERLYGKTIMELHDLGVGYKESYTKQVIETDIRSFALLSGDEQPLHTNKEHAEKKTKFKGIIAHGLYTASFVSAVLGMKLPGPGTLLMHAQLNFLSPVFPGDTITATVTIFDVNFEHKNVTFLAECKNQDGVVVLEGHVVVKPPIEIH